MVKIKKLHLLLICSTFIVGTSKTIKVRDRSNEFNKQFYCHTIYSKVEPQTIVRGRLIYSDLYKCNIPKRIKSDYVFLMIHLHESCSLADIAVKAKREGYSAVILYGDTGWPSHAEEYAFLEGFGRDMYFCLANKLDTKSFQEYFAHPNNAKYQATIMNDNILPFERIDPDVLQSWIYFILAILLPIVIYMLPPLTIADENDSCITEKTEILVFHRKCVLLWFEERHCCPLCRREVTNCDKDLEFLPDISPEIKMEMRTEFLLRLFREIQQRASQQADLSQEDESFD